MCIDIDTIADVEADVDYIYGKINDWFGIQTCSPQIMLGVERRLTQVEDVTYLEFLMTSFIEEMHDEWKAKWTELGRSWSSRVPKVPFPVSTILSTASTEKNPRPSDTEIAKTTQLFMHMTGQLLWLSRMCMPDMLYACSQFSRALSASGWDALEYGMQAIKYAYSQRH